MATLRWHGDRVEAAVAAAAAVGIDVTMAGAVANAKADHPGYPPPSQPDQRFHSRTGFTVGSIRIMRPAEVEGDTVAGEWGSDAKAALYLEIGTSTDGPTAQERALAAHGNMSEITPAIGPLMAPRPFLRPACDVEYPHLPERIRQAFEKTL